MKNFPIFSFLLLAVRSTAALAQQRTPARAQAASNGLLTPKYIQPSDNSTDQSSDVKAVIDVYGLSDLTKIGTDYEEEAAKSHFSTASPDGQYIHGKYSGLTSLDKPEIVAKANPINYVDQDDPPFLLFHGSRDMAVSPSQTLLLHNALREAGVPSTRYVLEGTCHCCCNRNIIY